MTEQKQSTGFWRKLWEQYKHFCDELDGGACRTCGVPEAKADENGNLIKKPIKPIK